MENEKEKYEPSVRDVIAFEIIDVLKKHDCSYWDAEAIIRNAQTWLKAQKIQSSFTCVL